jgi:hypothetical protein
MSVVLTPTYPFARYDMSDSDGHSLRPLASCAGRDLRDDIFRAISARETDPMGHAALPADDHAADQSAKGLLFPLTAPNKGVGTSTKRGLWLEVKCDKTGDARHSSFNKHP